MGLDGFAKSPLEERPSRGRAAIERVSFFPNQANRSFAKLRRNKKK
jgi:hypothetical protein